MRYTEAHSRTADRPGNSSATWTQGKGQVAPSLIDQVAQICLQAFFHQYAPSGSIATPMIGGVVTYAILELLIYPVGYVIWRKRELGFMNNVKLKTLLIVRRLLLRNLLGAGTVFLFLRRLLARGFRRFVAHKHNAKVHGNRRQHSDGVYHYPGACWYGNTKQGKLLSEADARAQGYRPANERTVISDRPVKLETS